MCASALCESEMFVCRFLSDDRRLIRSDDDPLGLYSGPVSFVVIIFALKFIHVPFMSLIITGVYTNWPPHVVMSYKLLKYYNNFFGGGGLSKQREIVPFI